MYFFTSDQHFGHWTSPERNIIRYCNRPFKTIEEMDNVLISRFNSLVSKNDITIHAGDFTLAKRALAQEYISRLNGEHIFLRGSHDYWLKGTKSHEIWEGRIEKQYIVICHYAMRTWARSHYNSWQCFGHSHGRLDPIGKQWDIGVDNNDFYPVSFEKLKEIMCNRPNNPNLVSK